jgi:hypothetical protein
LIVFHSKSVSGIANGQDDEKSEFCDAVIPSGFWNLEFSSLSGLFKRAALLKAQTVAGFPFSLVESRLGSLRTAIESAHN